MQRLNRQKELRHAGPVRNAPAPALGLLAFLLCAGCAGPQSTLDAHGPVAAGIVRAWWIMAVAAVLILLIVMALVLYAVLRDPQRRRPLPSNLFLVAAGIVLPSLLLAALLVYGTDLGRRITQAAADPLRIQVIGHRWWWEVRYPGDVPVVTANELHLPLARPVEIEVTSADVIHSFWIPNLGGKLDMIPGVTSTLRLSATSEGRFRAQCAEFCGPPHAHMGFIATVQSPARFDAWLAARSRPASVTALDEARFARLGCGGCHAIAGTSATGSGGPALTHVGSRPTLGAAAAPLNATSLRAWLANHGQFLKPGSTAPAQSLAADELEAMARMLEALK